MNFSKSIAPMKYFDRLPEGCICEIISKTTPVDAVRSTILSKDFKIVVESDAIWGRFLPPDYQEIIDRSEFPPICNNKKELFFSLCDSPILLDGGKLSFFLDKHSRKKCFMMSPRELIVSENDHTHFWQWKEHPLSRFSEVAYLGYVRSLDFRGSIEAKKVSPKTDYVAYLVFILVDTSNGLESTNMTITFVNHSETATEVQGNIVQRSTFSKLRGDGWMEIELGNLISKEGSDDLFLDSLIEIQRPDNELSGLNIEGIEFRLK